MLLVIELWCYLFEVGDVDFYGVLLMLCGNVLVLVFDMFEVFCKSVFVYVQLVVEYCFIEQYKVVWKDVFYVFIFVIIDVVVVYLGYVLLVWCCLEFGKGLWVLFGGFVGQEQSLFDSCLCELCEEIWLKILLLVLKGLLKGQQVFDYFDCSQCGCIIIYGFYFEFLVGELLLVCGGDDVDKVCWILVSEVLDMGLQLFEDYLYILEYFFGRG